MRKMHVSFYYDLVNCEKKKRNFNNEIHLTPGMFDSWLAARMWITKDKNAAPKNNFDSFLLCYFFFFFVVLSIPSIYFYSLSKVTRDYFLCFLMIARARLSVTDSSLTSTTTKNFLNAFFLNL